MDEADRQADRLHRSVLGSIGDALRAPGVTVRLVVSSANEADQAVEHIEQMSLLRDIAEIDDDLRAVTFTNGSRIVVQIGDAA